MPPEFEQRRRELEKRKRELPQRRHRIGFTTDLLMKMAALFFDILGVVAALIPFAGTMVGIVGSVSFFLFYLFIGVKPLQKGSGRKSIIVRIISFFFEIIPVVGMLPAFTISIFYTNRVVRKEDKEYNKSIKSVSAQLETDMRTLQYDMQKYGAVVAEQQYDNETEFQQNNQNEDDRMAA